MDRGVGNKWAYISRYATVDDHRNHSAKENDDHERVDQTEPMDTRVKDMKVVVPSSCLLGIDNPPNKNGVEKSLPMEWKTPEYRNGQSCLCSETKRPTFHITRYEYRTRFSSVSLNTKGGTLESQSRRPSWEPPRLKETNSQVSCQWVAKSVGTSRATQGRRLYDSFRDLESDIWIFRHVGHGIGS